jgi:hypothetical protein
MAQSNKLNNNSLFLFRDESVESGLDSKSSSAASSSSATDLKELSSVLMHKISQGGKKKFHNQMKKNFSLFY